MSHYNSGRPHPHNWRYLANLTSPVSDACAAVLDGRMWLVGGLGGAHVLEPGVKEWRMGVANTVATVVKDNWGGGGRGEASILRDASGQVGRKQALWRRSQPAAWGNGQWRRGEEVELHKDFSWEPTCLWQGLEIKVGS